MQKLLATLMKNKFFVIAVIGIFFISIIYFSKTRIAFNSKINIRNDNTKLQVTASFYPWYFFASVIGGDKANVTNITPVGSEPHNYEPSAGDIARIERGSMIILNGYVENWGDKMKDNLKNTNVAVVVVGEGLFTQKETEGDKTNIDPHIWLAPQLVKNSIKKITQGYIQIDPKNSSYYETNEKQIQDKLEVLDHQYKNGLATCKYRDIITSHAGFNYLASSYKLHQVSIAGLTPDSEPSAQKLTEIVKFAKKYNLKYIFFESLVSPKLSETIASEIGAQTLVLNPLEGMTSTEFRQGKNYFTVMEDNLKNLQKALECQN